MRRFALFLMMMAAAPAAAAEKKVGTRTDAPERLLSGIGEGSSDAEYERLAEAASAHPLGSLENPVRVGGPEGERAYIGRLRCADGEAPQVAARTAGGVGGFGSVVSLYRLDCRSAAPGKAELRMDMYHAEHRETAAPAGFTLAR